MRVEETYVDIDVMVVAERKAREVAVKIEHNVAIDIDKEITSALLRVNEAVDLVALVDVVALSLLEGLLVLGAWEGSLDLRLGVFVGVLESQEA